MRREDATGRREGAKRETGAARRAIGTCALVVVVGTIGVGCKRSGGVAPASSSSAASGEVAPPPFVGDASVAARCALIDGAAALSDPASPRSLEIGEAVAVNDGIAVGLTRVASGKTEAAVAVVSYDLARVRVRLVKGNGVAPDAPPPKPIANGDAPLALFAALSIAPQDAGVTKRTTPLALLRTSDAEAQTLASMHPSADESLVSDALVLANGSAIVAWDEDAPAGERGVIEVASVTLDGKESAKVNGHVVSLDGSDDESPRIAPRPGGAWLAWLARRPEPVSDAAIDDRALEAPAERRAYQWVDVVPLDEHGAAAGPVRKLTSSTGHVGAFDLEPRATGELDVFARDDDQPSEGAGGSLSRITVREGGIDAPVVLVADGVGRGAFDVVTSAPNSAGQTWLSYVDAGDHVRVAPLSASRGLAGAPSVEPSLEGGRILAVTPTGALIAAFPAEEKQLRLITCRP